MQPNTFLQELRRRSIFRVAVMYTVATWVLLQVGDVLSDPLSLPGWFQSTLIGLLVIGFPITLLLAWIFDVTPEGIVRSTDDSLKELERLRKRHKIDYAIIGTLVVALALTFYQQPSDESVAVLDGDIPSTVEDVAKTVKPSIAVLAFTDLSPDGDQAYFAEGVAEELLNGLVAVDGLSVASRTSSFAFKREDRSITDIANILQVNYIVEGSVRRAGDQVRITAQLIDTRDDRHLWSDSYNLTFSVARLFTIQDEITAAIVLELRDTLGLDAAAITTPRQAPTEDVDAYELYLQSREGPVFTSATYHRALDLLERAVALDPYFAAAWGQLAFMAILLPDWNPSVEREAYYAQARDAATRALLLDPQDGRGHQALAYLAVRDRDWETAYRHDALAVELSLGYANLVLLRLGYLNEALEGADRVIDRAGDQALLTFVYSSRSWVLLSLKRHEDGLASLAQSILGGNTGRTTSLMVPQTYAETGRRADWAIAYAHYLDGSDSVPSLRPLLPYIEQLVFSDDGEAQTRIDRFWTVVTELGYDRDALLAAADRFLLAELGEFEVLAGRIEARDKLAQTWLPGFQAFRGSDAFKRMLHEAGIVTYWREHGWPDLCRPKEPDDFVYD